MVGFAELNRVGVTVPGLLGQCFVDNAADQLADRKIQLVDGLWRLVQDGIENLFHLLALERPDSS